VEQLLEQRKIKTRMNTEDRIYKGKVCEAEGEVERERERKLRKTSGFVTLSDKCPLLLRGGKNLLQEIFLVTGCLRGRGKKGWKYMDPLYREQLNIADKSIFVW
jgi:hypothetical protein